MKPAEGSFFNFTPPNLYLNSVYEVISEICGQEYQDPSRLVFKSGLYGGCLLSAELLSADGSKSREIVVTRMSAKSHYCQCDEDTSVEKDENLGTALHKCHNVWQGVLPKDVFVKDLFKTYLRFLRDGMRNVVKGKRAKTIIWNRGTPTVKEQNETVSCEENVDQVRYQQFHSANVSQEDPKDTTLQFDEFRTDVQQQQQLIRNEVPHTLTNAGENIIDGFFRSSDLKSFDEEDFDIPSSAEYSEIEDLSIDQFPHVVSFVEKDTAHVGCTQRNDKTAINHFRASGDFEDDLDVSIPRRSVSLVSMYSYPETFDSKLNDADINIESVTDGTPQHHGFLKTAIIDRVESHEVAAASIDDTTHDAYRKGPLDYTTCQDFKCGPPGCEGEKCVPCTLHSNDEGGYADKSTFVKSLTEDIQKKLAQWVDQLYGPTETKHER